MSRERRNTYCVVCGYSFRVEPVLPCRCGAMQAASEALPARESEPERGAFDDDGYWRPVHA